MADGFFDRHYIQNSNTNFANSAVRPTSADAGYIGRLFYNPNNLASLFIPAPGYRGTTTGQLNGTGRYGYYWSASSNSASTSWILYMRQPEAFLPNSNRSSGSSIRCVKE
ncbi:MAG: fibrobacter succinogenes major paralogous domain-containing protein [Alistipes sp.]|nr:fibrobacter succinogenes major paralogous domain-containing protein [Alistipes sp.]